MKSKLLFPLFALVFTFITSSQTINNPSDLIECSDTDFENFNLESRTSQILGDLSQNDYTVTYHETESDALQQVNSLSSPYVNLTNPQTIYVAVIENATGNLQYTSFDLIVEVLAFPNLQNVYEVCPGSEIEVVSGLDNQQYTFTWYFDGFAIPGEELPYIIIAEPGIYSLQVTSIEGCSSFTDFELVQGSLDGIATPTPYVVCDDDGDGFGFFNLETKTPEILNGIQNPSLIVTYHETQADADADTNILDPLYTNIVAFNQTLFARVESSPEGCFATTTLELEVDINCVVTQPVEAFVCVDDFNMSVDYDLTIHEAELVVGQDPSDFNFTYYELIQDAENEVNPIPNPELYFVTDNTTVIYVRVENNQSENFDITEIYLNYILNPQVDFNGPYAICDGQDVVLTPFINDNQQYSYLWSTGETSPEIIVSEAGIYTLTVTDIWSNCSGTASVEVIDGGNAPTLSDASDLYNCEPGAVFDLTTTVSEILNGQDPNQFVISFHNDINSALSGTNPIVNPDIYSVSNSVETIFVRVENVGDSCFAISDFTVTNDNSCPVVVDCGQEAVSNSFCYDNNQDDVYQYESNDGSPLQVVFIEGQVENNFDELIILDSDGTTNLNPITVYGNNGDLTGLIFTSSGNSISISVTSDGSISCSSQNYTPILYEVSCADPNALPNCTSVLTQPTAGSDGVSETTDLSWTPSSGVVNGYILSVGITSGGTEVVDHEDVGNVLNYDLDVLDYAVTYYVTITPYNDNGNAENCEEFSFTTRANPNQTVVCGQSVINTTYCYDNNDDSEFNFQSSDGLPLTIVFNAGGTEVNFDPVYIVDSDGTILNPTLEYGNGGDFTGLTYTSSGDSLSVRFNTDGSVSCASGSGCCTEQFDFDVFCASSVGIIEVNAFVDDNGNSVFDTDEFSFSNGYFTYEVNGDGMINTVNSSTGSFQIISTNETDTYDINFNLYEESAGCYDITVAMFDDVSVATGNTLTIDFPVVEEQSCEDLAVYLINYWTPPRPGFSHENHIVLENLGFTTIASGTVEFTADPLLVFNSATADNPTYTITNTANGFTVDFVNLQPGDIEYIDISLTCPASVALGDIVTNTANYVTDSNDMVLSNNYSTLSELVVGSWDPNDKMESHGPRINYDNFAASDEWLYYTIRFQNLGTFAATFVTIEDTLDSQLDESTFQMLRSSHDYVVTRTEHNLEWYFEDINLPAAQDDEEGSQGYVYFRIKPEAGYEVGDIIPNTAAIYFDFNAPVITNRFESEFVDDALSVVEVELNGFDMFPNPASDLVTIKLNSISDAILRIVDVQGKLITEQDITGQLNVNINISDLQTGLYFVKLDANDKTTIKKLIKH